LGQPPWKKRTFAVPSEKNAGIVQIRKTPITEATLAANARESGSFGDKQHRGTVLQISKKSFVKGDLKGLALGGGVDFYVTRRTKEHCTPKTLRPADRQYLHRGGGGADERKIHKHGSTTPP